MPDEQGAPERPERPNRPRRDNREKGSGQGQGQNQPKKPKVRIGPRHRRQELAQAAPAKPDPKPHQQQRPPKGPPQGAGTEQAPGGIRRKRKRKKNGRRSENGEHAQAPVEGVEYQARQVLPPVQDDMDEIPSGVFKTVDPADFADDSSVDGGDEETEAPKEGESAPQEGSGPKAANSRDRRKRKKRKDRHDPPPVDRSRGFWWAEQWVRSFEMLFPSNASRSRMAKGRTYARRGQVVELEVGPNGVLARVQGSRPRPYQVRLELNRLRRETWGRILHQVAGKAAFLAQLLEGTLPPEIEEVFFASGARLFPHGDNDIRARCNCPDPVTPCKHTAALNYALAEALERDPFLLFALRGKSRDQLLQDLREMRGRDRTQASTPVAEENLKQFWRMGRLAESVLRPMPWNHATDPARLVQSLGEPQLEGIREGSFLSLLESTYRQVSEAMRRLPKDS